MAHLHSETIESSENPPSQFILSKSHTENLVETLPTREGWATPLVLYSNCWIRANSLKDSMAVKDKLKPRPDDIILAAHPKCGTTWLKALVFTIVNRSRYTFTDHPLLTRRPHQVVPYLALRPGDLDIVETLPSLRLLSTHLPLSLLPSTVSTLGCRIVCVCRDPKDAFISRWHFEKRMNQGMSIGMDEAFTMFCEGCSPYGPFWDRYLEYWKESLARPHEVMFLRYEEIVSDTPKVISKLASFLGVPFTQEEDSNGVVEQIEDLCGFTSLSNIAANRSSRVEHEQAGEKLVVDPTSLFRKGKVGDWVNHMSKDMGDRMDQLVAEKFKGSGLIF
ncbi:cytosolic sulfotransferase 17-like [Triticum dicoccoides]|uniref:cytosolic sulfotransferase 17-like n=1 Tax=Triticum dicoccoides TaxID=85692 RepID=UPI00188F22DC|nr:cytosolic sulfotransferase 17-like [Triticum dicoccoides]